jgi:hypothetical protein
MIVKLMYEKLRSAQRVTTQSTTGKSAQCREASRTASPGCSSALLRIPADMSGAIDSPATGISSPWRRSGARVLIQAPFLAGSIRSLDEP